MNVAALYDVHGNLPALEAVLAEVDADVIVVGGDIAAGLYPAQTLERLRALPNVRFIRGNADRELVEPGPPREAAPPDEVLEWVRGQLSDEQLGFLHGLPEREVVAVDGLGDVVFVHATPQNDFDIFTEITPEERLRPVFSGVGEPVVTCGHTHMQFDRMVGGVRVVNAGSVGMPYEARPGAYWALLGPDVMFRRSEYEPAAPEAGGYPGEWPRASREEATAHFERLALGG